MERFWNHIWTPIALGFLCLMLTACERPISEGLSTISIQAPTNAAFSKVGSLTAPPTNQKACYGVNITGVGIESQKGNACSPETGTLAGFAGPGEIIAASVLKGPARKIELYMYLQEVGQNLPCPKLAASFSADQLKKTYYMGSVTMDLSKSEENVDIVAEFPGLSQTFAQQMSLPASCTGATSSSNLIGFGVSTAKGHVTDGSIHLYGRVGRTRNATTLTGTGIKLHVRK